MICEADQPVTRGCSRLGTDREGIDRQFQIDYGELLPDMFQINAGRFFMQLASEADRPRVLDIVSRERRLGQWVYVGVINVINEEVESAETVAERVLEAAEILGAESVGTTDDCGFSPFGDDTATARATAFAKIKARIDGTKIAAKKLSGA